MGNQMVSEQQLRLVTEPLESLHTEYKPWIDLDAPEGRADLVRTCLALRNYGGGQLVVGFRDKGGLYALPPPESSGRNPQTVRQQFSGDNVSRLVGQYALSPFETAVHLVPHGGGDYPVIEVPAGIRTPVATKQGIENSRGMPLLVKN